MRHTWPLVALALAACAGTRADAAASDARPSALAADSVRGVLQATGSEPAVTFVVVDGAGRVIALEGDRALLRRLQGVEVAVRGTAHGAVFRVEDVAVRAANGVPAVDGVLARDADRDVLVMRDGTRHVIARLPEALRGQVRARVWLAGPLDGDIDAFGVITDGR